MDIGTISMRYAKALLAYAQEEGVEDVVYQEVKTLNKSLIRFSQLREALDNPILTADDKLALISAAAVGDAEPSAVFIRFIRLVLKKHREVLIVYISPTYMYLYYQLKNIAVGTLITAVPVAEDLKQRIKEIASIAVHAEMKLQTIVDPAIGGGFVFDINDYRLDASIATQLKRVKQQFIDKNKRIV